MQSSSQIITTNKPTPSFLQAGCPSCRPTNSVKALKGKYHIPWTCLPQAHLGVFQLCLWLMVDAVKQHCSLDVVFVMYFVFSFVEQLLSSPPSGRMSVLWSSGIVRVLFVTVDVRDVLHCGTIYSIGMRRHRRFAKQLTETIRRLLTVSFRKGVA